ncbi:alpha/beta fold hydrolase [Arcicella rigui]|uniref:Alpha/beta hydrolase n=1 Tax=Arcicella rigui TaxID=797020 RepID=A0ABU5Q711_9BACT|nr:alpha/beta hydrolase [Arcicella rigui]MEA5138352.1 alpha/beta hydrolase [Arcicella rigui]
MKKAVVLLHGFGEDSTIWSGYVPFLQKDFFIITPEYARLSHLKTIEQYADFVNDIVVASGFEKCILIGHSMGGYIALAFAEKYAEKVLGLSLFHSTAFADSDEKKVARSKNVEFLKTHGTEAFIKATTPNLYAETFAKKYPEIIQKHILASSTLPVEALIAGMEAMRERPDRKHVLKSLRCPVMFIIGEKDKSVAPADAKAQIMIPKFFSSLILDEVAHMGMIEEPEDCLKFVGKFLLKC